MVDTSWTEARDFADALDDAVALTDGLLGRLIPEVDGPEAQVWDAMRYAALAPGKRLRPFFVLATSSLFGVSTRNALQVAAAIELIHAYSLVHDDLPAMDDSDLRRGRPTCHKQFDEATAILAGDGLLTLAFEVIASDDTHADPAVQVELARELAKAAGAGGMVGGQMIDLLAESQGPEVAADIGAITRLQRMKTGALIAFSCVAGPILGQAPVEARFPLNAYAHDLGLAFQIADDLLDAESSAEATGKSVGRDAEAGKATFVSILGIERARDQARRLVDQAIQHLDLFGDRADLLKQAASFVVDRKR